MVEPCWPHSADVPTRCAVAGRTLIGGCGRQLAFGLLNQLRPAGCQSEIALRASIPLAEWLVV